MNVFARFDVIPSMILQDIKETKHYGHTLGRSEGRTDVKTVYPPTNTVCGDITMYYSQIRQILNFFTVDGIQLNWLLNYSQGKICL